MTDNAYKLYIKSFWEEKNPKEVNDVSKKMFYKEGKNKQLAIC